MDLRSLRHRVRARAVIAFVTRCGGSTTHDALGVEFIDRRRYFPEDFDAALSEAVDAGALVRDGETVRAVEP